MPHLILNVDGAARGNPGPASTGVVISTPDGVDILTRGEYIGETTNNVAEYKGLIDGLKRAPDFLTKQKAPEIEVRSDSELMVRQMTGVYRVKNPGLKPLFEEAQRLARKFTKVTYCHIPREENGKADRLCNLALNVKGVVEELE